METKRQDNPASADPPKAAEFHWGRFAFWLPACSIHGALVAWVAVVVEGYRAPLLLFSLLLGLGLGATLVGLMRVSQVGNRPTVLLGTVLAASVTVVGQHYIGYHVACEKARADAETYQLAKQVYRDMVLGSSPIPPESFRQFLRWQAARGFDLGRYRAQGSVVWLIWAVDGLLVLAAALVLVVPALRKQYCSRCRSWFRTTRSGPVDANAARKLAALVEVELPDELASARYRLATCNRGCNPTRFELRWDRSSGSSSSAEVWLDVDRRNQIVETLDKATENR